MSILVLLGVMALVAWLVWRSQRTLWVVDIRNTDVFVVRGQPPIALLTAIREIAERDAIAHARLTARRGQHGGILRTSGLEEGPRQRLQNVYRLQPEARLRSS
ncbi:MAG: DUF3634 family protein [Myxococcota bacterium]